MIERAIQFLSAAASIISIIFIMGLCLFGTGCAVNHYAKAEMYLNEKKFDSALEEYLSLIQVNQRLGVKKNSAAYIGAAISYHNLGQYKEAMKMCKQVLRVDPNNGAALYYLGISLEKLGMDQLAMSCYKRFDYVAKESPYHSFLKARMNILVQQKK